MASGKRVSSGDDCGDSEDTTQYLKTKLKVISPPTSTHITMDSTSNISPTKESGMVVTLTSKTGENKFLVDVISDTIMETSQSTQTLQFVNPTGNNAVNKSTQTLKNELPGILTENSTQIQLVSALLAGLTESIPLQYKYEVFQKHLQCKLEETKLLEELLSGLAMELSTQTEILPNLSTNSSNSTPFFEEVFENLPTISMQNCMQSLDDHLTLTLLTPTQLLDEVLQSTIVSRSTQTELLDKESPGLSVNKVTQTMEEILEGIITYSSSSQSLHSSVELSQVDMMTSSEKYSLAESKLSIQTLSPLLTEDEEEEEEKVCKSPSCQEIGLRSITCKLSSPFNERINSYHEPFYSELFIESNDSRENILLSLDSSKTQQTSLLSDPLGSRSFESEVSDISEANSTTASLSLSSLHQKDSLHPTPLTVQELKVHDFIPLSIELARLIRSTLLKQEDKSILEDTMNSDALSHSPSEQKKRQSIPSKTRKRCLSLSSRPTGSSRSPHDEKEISKTNVDSSNLPLPSSRLTGSSCHPHDEKELLKTNVDSSALPLSSSRLTNSSRSPHDEKELPKTNVNSSALPLPSLHTEESLSSSHQKCQKSETVKVLHSKKGHRLKGQPLRALFSPPPTPPPLPPRRRRNLPAPKAPRFAPSILPPPVAPSPP